MQNGYPLYVEITSLFIVRVFCKDKSFLFIFAFFCFFFYRYRRSINFSNYKNNILNTNLELPFFHLHSKLQLFALFLSF